MHTICHRGFLNISADEITIGALRVKFTGLLCHKYQNLMGYCKYSLFTVECKARFTSASVAADMEVEIEVYLQIQCPFPVRFSKVSISLNHQVSQYILGLLPAILRKGPWPKLGKNDQLNSKSGRN